MHWIPRTEDELRSGLQDGLLRESHHLDLKRHPPSGKGGNKDIAKDIASLAIDGGVLVFGVDEASGTLSPFRLTGFSERVDQIARSLIDEPLRVRVEVLPSVESPGVGYALVIVPESPSAPHMVDLRYRGRGDTTNIVLSDAEVVRLHERRQRERSGIEDLLMAEIERDPSPSGQRRQAHMFVVAEPVTNRREMLLEVIDDSSPTRWIMENLINGRPGVRLTEQWSPDLSIASNVSRTADGWSAHTGYLAPGREPLPEADEDDLFEVEIRENGGIRLFCSRATASHPHADSPGRVALETIIGGLTLRTTLIAGVIADKCEHNGAWDLGLAVTNLRGAVSWAASRSLTGYAVPYSSDDYKEVASAMSAELTTDPVEIVGRLFARLNRALNGGSVPIPRPAQ